ncbi:hypothetical protein AAFP30_16285 [Gordonia sp. CPCC 205515]|uniref:hypothetical protein n=1 Tax=Gordonia sp. CPCC 205515 TaxID=3140791 RepID=UPI003AF3FAB3
MSQAGSDPADDNGIVLLPSVPGHVVTDAMVADSLADEFPDAVQSSENVQRNAGVSDSGSD